MRSESSLNITLWVVTCGVFFFGQMSDWMSSWFCLWIFCSREIITKLLSYQSVFSTAYTDVPLSLLNDCRHVNVTKHCTSNVSKWACVSTVLFLCMHWARGQWSALAFPVQWFTWAVWVTRPIRKKGKTVVMHKSAACRVHCHLCLWMVIPRWQLWLKMQLLSNANRKSHVGHHPSSSLCCTLVPQGHFLWVRFTGADRMQYSTGYEPVSYCHPSRQRGHGNPQTRARNVFHAYIMISAILGGLFQSSDHVISNAKLPIWAILWENWWPLQLFFKISS